MFMILPAILVGNIMFNRFGRQNEPLDVRGTMANASGKFVPFVMTTVSAVTHPSWDTLTAVLYRSRPLILSVAPTFSIWTQKTQT
jgi:hypothetical protein